MKINTESWAIKVNRRSFYKHAGGGVVTLNTRQDAMSLADTIARARGIKAEPVRVKVRIEEME